MLTRCRPMLGTLVEVTVPDEAAGAVEAAFGAIAHVQERMSFHSEKSDLARLRGAPAGAPVEVAAETVQVLRIALDLHHYSGGLFDVTIGRELVRGGFLPRPRAWRSSAWTGTSSDIEIAGERLVRCHRPMLIDLGGIAKGYAVDLAVEALRSAGVSRALVNAGGDLRMFGDCRWDILLRDGDGSLRRSLRLANCAVASSANLLDRRRALLGRVRTPHIGFGRKPLAHGGRVTIAAWRCVIADAMTKIAMADQALAERMLQSLGGRVIVEADPRKAA